MIGFKDILRKLEVVRDIVYIPILHVGLSACCWMILLIVRKIDLSEEDSNIVIGDKRRLVITLLS